MASAGTDGREVSNIGVCKWCGDLLERWHCVGLVEWYNGDVRSERNEVDTEKGERMETRDQGVVFGWSRGAGVLRGEVQTPAKPPGLLLFCRISGSWTGPRTDAGRRWILKCVRADRFGGLRVI